jgi:hypothetical protein
MKYQVGDMVKFASLSSTLPMLSDKHLHKRYGLNANRIEPARGCLGLIMEAIKEKDAWLNPRRREGSIYDVLWFDTQEKWLVSERELCDTGHTETQPQA